MKPFSVCIIGSSGIAPLYWAWRKRSFPLASTFSLKFYTGGGAAFSEMAYQDGVFAPTSDRLKDRFAVTAGEETEIVVAKYDAFVIYGLGIGIYPLLSIFSRVGTVDHWPYGYAEQLVSKSCLQRILRAKLARTQSFKLMTHLRKAFKGPLIILPAPLLPEPCFDEKGVRAPYVGDGEFLQRLSAELTEAVHSSLADFNLDIIWQDESTLGRPGTSKAEFGFRAMNFKGSESADCNKHMNEDFGALALTTLFERLNELSAGRVLEAPPARRTAVREMHIGLNSPLALSGNA
jgi:hypothetical protein